MSSNSGAPPKSGLFLVNGTLCELSIDADSIAWCTSGASNSSKRQQGCLSLDQIIGYRYALDKSRAKQAPFNHIPPQDIDESGAAQQLKVYYARENSAKSTSKLLKLARIIISSADHDTKSATININTENDAQRERRKMQRRQQQQQQQQHQLHQSKLQTDPATRCSSDHLSKDNNNTTKDSHLATTTTAHQRVSEPPSCYASEASSNHLSSLSLNSTPSISQQSENSSSLRNIDSEIELAPSVAGRDAADRQRQSGDPGARQDHAPLTSLRDLGQELDGSLDGPRQLRPKRILVFVNPFGGKGKAQSLFERHVRRLLEIAGVDYELVVTKYANNARDMIEDEQFNVEYFDGIVCVGGDGMFSELMNGLLFRYNREKLMIERVREKASHTSDSDEAKSHATRDSGAGSLMRHGDTKDSGLSMSALDCMRDSLGGIGEQFVSPPIPVGVIGAGSTDANAFGIIGTNDVITATLNIILGRQIDIDVCSVHSLEEDNLIRFVSTFVAYGYFGDVVRESEKLRWLGPSRYDVTGFNSLMKNRAYEGLVRIILSSKDGSPNDQQRCHSDCQVCRACKDRSSPNTEGLRLVEKRGPFVGVNAAITACRCPKTKKGFSPNNHLANGCTDLILVRPCTRLQYIRYLLRTGWTKRSAFDLKYVEAFRCRQFEFIANNKGSLDDLGYMSSTSSSSSASSTSTTSVNNSSNGATLEARKPNSNKSSSSWNLDGEVLKNESIRVKVNNQLLKVFGTGEPIATN